MKNKFKSLFVFSIGIIMVYCSVSNAVELQSPDGDIQLLFDIRDMGNCSACPVYMIKYKGEPAIAPSKMGFNLAGDVVIKDGFEIVSVETSSSDSTWNPVYGERSVIRDNYNQLIVKLKQTGEPGYTIDITFRCYDSGAAFMTTINGNGRAEDIEIASENTEFRFNKNYDAWQVTSAQGEYEKKPIGRMWEEVDRPLVVELAPDRYVAIGEAKLVDYARMKLVATGGKRPYVVSRLSSEVKSSLPLSTPWRVIMVAESPGELVENNDIFLNLNDPSKIADTSWIKPGKVLREVTLTTAGGKASIDFAAAHNMQYIMFDAGWYGPENDNSSDATTVTLDPKRSSGPLDLQEVISYGEERGIGVILYVNHRALEQQLDELLPLFKEWGVKGIKFGFVNVGSQEWTSWMHEAVRKTAQFEMMVDIHDEYRPTGYSRTYPNLMTQEGIGGDETSPSNSQTLAIAFTRMIAGAGDNTICYFSSRVDKNATHAYQLAKMIVLYSPWQFLYWYDRPQASPGKKGGAGGAKNVILDVPELEFYDAAPTVWDDTNFLHGSIGEYAVVARRSGEEWYIGAMNGDTDRTFEVALDFLDPDQKYIATIFSDDETIETPTHVKIDKQEVTASTILKIALPSRGGQAIRIVPAE